MAGKKPWAGRFSQGTHKAVEEFTVSLHFDHKLYRYDIEGSIAHCRMLARQKIIAAGESKKIIAGLQEIRQELDAGKLALRPEFEDIHMLIESRLIEKIGPVGGKLHTARSRNDQIALDVSLYLRDAVRGTIGFADAVQQALLGLAEKNIDAVLPGFTHMQHAQPVLFAHHLLAYFEMLGRDRDRLESCYIRVNRMPLGAGALAGTPHPIDREYVAKLLGYPEVTRNSMDTVADRDTQIEFCACAAIIMMHLSRFCEELILWMSSEFQFIDIADGFCTGSSIMPQKKNPDVAELVRGKTGRVYGNLMGLLTLLKSLPLAYNRDLQEDKIALFDTVETVNSCLNIMALMLPEIKVNKNKMRAATQSGFLTATDLADYLVSKKMPFRTAHEVVGKVVAYCVKTGKSLWDLKLAELQQFSPVFKADVMNWLTIDASVNSRTCTGGTATQAVKKALAAARAGLKKKKKI
jgi:argininosuccinate lyase